MLLPHPNNVSRNALVGSENVKCTQVLPPHRLWLGRLETSTIVP